MKKPTTDQMRTEMIAKKISNPKIVTHEMEENNLPNEKTHQRFYHGGYDPKEGVWSEVPTGKAFHGFFAHHDKKSSWGAHGRDKYYADVPKNKILTHYDLRYNLPHEKTLKAFSEVTGVKPHHPNFEQAWNAVIEDDQNSAENTGFKDVDLENPGHIAQKYRGQIAKKLGYSAVEMNDEHGTSHLLLPGTKLTKVIKENNPKIIHKAEGGSMDTPTIAQMRFQINQHKNPDYISNIGIDQAVDMDPKRFISPNPRTNDFIPVGGVADSDGLPVGGVDQNNAQQGQQMMPAQTEPQPNQDGQPNSAPEGADGQQPGGYESSAPQGATPPMGNLLSMTPQGQTMQAMGPAGMAEGGQPKRKTFAIQPANPQPKKEPEFTPYDPKKISIGNLSKAFDESIAHHLSLSHEDRIANSAKAAKAVGKFIGVNKDGKVKDLLGKNAKLLKTETGKDEEPIKLPDGRGVETTGLALAPAYEEAGFNTCPNSASCKAECLGKTSGNYFKLGGGQDLSEFKGPRLNSLLKTQAFLHDPHSFAIKLHDEIQAAKDMAGANGNHLGVRLNVLSDINPRVHKAIINAHPDVTFYDYTKNNTNPVAPNHHYTYSSTGASQEGVDNPNTNWKQMRKRLMGGDNVAMAFTHKTHLPEHVHDEETGQKFKVINGDSHDFRPLDMQPEGEHGVIVGLKNKKATGEVDKSHIDSHGFFVHYDPKEKMTTNAKGKPIFERELGHGLTPKGKPRTVTIATNKEVSIKPQSEDLKLETNDGA
jgi:hypothetical protein